MERFLSQTAAIKVGSGCEPETTMGPLAHARRVPIIASMVEDAVAQGARVELGGQPIDGPGYFFSPTVLTDVPQTATLMKDEPFGPVVPCLRFSDLDDALRRANASPYGLSAYAFTRSTRYALQLQNGLQAGNVNINHFGQAAPEIPFGGVKDSGMGSEGGLESFDGYLQTKLVTQLD
jgi:succinate-semialdehyde dehydrogenase/glutarate-semialdehyde dehydrogenase